MVILNKINVRKKREGYQKMKKALLLVGLLSISSLSSAQEDVFFESDKSKLNCDILTEAAWDIAGSAQNGDSIEEVAKKYREKEFSGKMSYLIDSAIYDAYFHEIKENKREKFLFMYEKKLKMYSRCINLK